MLSGSCTLSMGISAKRKEMRVRLASWAAVWPNLCVFPETYGRERNLAYIADIRRAHILRMDGVPKTFPDGRPLPRAFKGHPPVQKRTEGKGKGRRPI